MNILKYSISLTILLKCATASESGVKGDVIKALSGFQSLIGFNSHQERLVCKVGAIAMIYLIMWLQQSSHVYF